MADLLIVRARPFEQIENFAAEQALCTCMKTHPTDSTLHRLSCGRLTTAASLRLQRHLFNCSNCLNRLLEIEVINEGIDGIATLRPKVDKRKPLFIVHDTGDGMIYSRADRRGSRWIARHWGPELAGARQCRTMREANEYLASSFVEMFPEHRCTARCRVQGDG
jgi:hypothetical protein